MTAPSDVTTAVRTDEVAGFPRAGDSYAAISTGDSSILTSANDSPSSGASLGGVSLRGDTDFDVTIIRVDFNAGDNVNCLLGIDFRFLSEEYPEFVGSSFNDAFIVELDESTGTTSGSAIEAPGNIAFDPEGNPITINAAGVTSMSVEDAAGTTFDGATPLLQAAAPLTPGPHSLFLSIFDQGDQILDSLVLVDNLRLGAVDDPDDCKPGAVPVDQDLTIRALPIRSVVAGDVDDEARIEVQVKIELPDGSPAIGSVVTIDGEIGGVTGADGLTTVSVPLDSFFLVTNPDGDVPVEATLGGLSGMITVDLFDSNPEVSCGYDGPPQGGNRLGKYFDFLSPSGGPGRVGKILEAIWNIKDLFGLGSEAIGELKPKDVRTSVVGSILTEGVYEPLYLVRVTVSQVDGPLSSTRLLFSSDPALVDGLRPADIFENLARTCLEIDGPIA